MKPWKLCGLLLIMSQSCLGQAIPNPRVFERPATQRAFAFAYENDYFSATDHYYTQGLYLLVYSPALRKNPVNYLLPHPKGWQHSFYLAAEHDAYTASSISRDTLIEADYPFSAAIMLKSGVQAIDTARGRILTTSLSLGLMGAGAGGYEMQYGIHKATGNILPRGWQYQLSNAPLINYEATFDQRIWQVRHVLLAGTASARAGTISVRAGLGGSLMAGIFDDPFRNHRGRRRLHAYAYASGNAYAIGYSAHLQGGVASGDNVYTVPASAVRRLVYQSRIGVCLGYGKASLLYFRDMNTREFETATPHAYGGLQLLVSW